MSEEKREMQCSIAQFSFSSNQFREKRKKLFSRNFCDRHDMTESVRMARQNEKSFVKTKGNKQDAFDFTKFFW